MTTVEVREHIRAKLAELAEPAAEPTSPSCESVPAEPAAAEATDKIARTYANFSVYVEENAEKLFKNGKVLGLSPIDTMSYARLKKMQEKIGDLVERLSARPDLEVDWDRALAFARVCARPGPKPHRPAKAHLRARSNWKLLHDGMTVKTEYQFATLLVLFAYCADAVAADLTRRAAHYEEVNDLYAERGWSVVEPDDLYQTAGVCQDLGSSVDPHEILLAPSAEWKDLIADVQDTFYLE